MKGFAKNEIEVGARVKFTRRHLKSYKCPATDPAWFMEGTVIGFSEAGTKPRQFARVKWDDGTVGLVNTSNVAVVGSVAVELSD